ncbi:MAG: Chromate resistance protein ChrB [Acidimicrobiales bacterium]
MPGQLEWVLLTYRLPREPSTPRITVWRKLRRLGAAQVVDGLVALPADARTKEQLEWLADEVTDAGGEATVWAARLGSVGVERTLAARMAARVAAEYAALGATAEAALGATAEAALGEPEATRRQTLGRLRRELRLIAASDHFPPAERARAEEALGHLADRAVTAP